MNAGPLSPITRLELLLLVVITAIGLGARTWHLEALPPGFYSDEAAYALDAQRVQAGVRDVYFESNNGREPLFIYTLAAVFSVWGPSPEVARATAAVFGSLAVIALWAAARALFGPQRAVIAAGLLAGSLWAIVLSRIALRVTVLPVVECLFIAGAVYAWRLRPDSARAPSSASRLSSLLEATAGALLGLLAYTYLAARLIPIALALTAVVALVWRRLTWADVRWGLRIAAVAGLVAGPMLVYAALRPEVYFGRATQVAVGSVQTVIDNLLAIAGMFTWRGDANWRHNLAGRPVFDPLTAVAFVIGGGLAIWQVIRRQDGAWLLVVMMWVMLLVPSLLSDRAPHFLRAIGAAPLSMCFPALALTAAGERLAAWGPRGARAGAVLAVVVVGVHGGAGVSAYFGPYAAEPGVVYAFETAVTELAQAARSCPTPRVDQRLLERYPAITFLAPDVRPLQVEELTLEMGCTFVSSEQSVASAIAAVPGPVAITAVRSGLYRPDEVIEGEPYPLYTQIQIAPFRWPSETRAWFANGVDLLVTETSMTDTTLVVTTTWGTRAPLGRDWQTYVHLRDAQGFVVTQADGPLGGELLPASTWRPGDGIIMVARLVVPDAGPSGQIIAIGLYDLADGIRVPLRTGAGEELQLPLPDR